MRLASSGPKVCPRSSAVACIAPVSATRSVAYGSSWLAGRHRPIARANVSNQLEVAVGVLRGPAHDVDAGAQSELLGKLRGADYGSAGRSDALPHALLLPLHRGLDRRRIAGGQADRYCRLRAHLRVSTEARVPGLDGSRFRELLPVVRGQVELVSGGSPIVFGGGQSRLGNLELTLDGRPLGLLLVEATLIELHLLCEGGVRVSASSCRRRSARACDRASRRRTPSRRRNFRRTPRRPGTPWRRSRTPVAPFRSWDRSSCRCCTGSSRCCRRTGPHQQWGSTPSLRRRLSRTTAGLRMPPGWCPADRCRCAGRNIHRSMAGPGCKASRWGPSSRSLRPSHGPGGGRSSGGRCRTR
jgi:hypothetical protein